MAGRADGREIQIVSTRHFKRPSACGDINTRPCGCWRCWHIPTTNPWGPAGRSTGTPRRGSMSTSCARPEAAKGGRASLPARRRRTCRASGPGSLKRQARLSGSLPWSSGTIPTARWGTATRRRSPAGSRRAYGPLPRRPSWAGDPTAAPAIPTTSTSVPAPTPPWPRSTRTAVRPCTTWPSTSSWPKPTVRSSLWRGRVRGCRSYRSPTSGLSSNSMPESCR
ncbi:MAG: hypothetical protein QOJ93_29 [Actinomycetota bacterium]|nr:hypothetical protein [Actinomycetota bacterium]